MANQEEGEIFDESTDDRILHSACDIGYGNCEDIWGKA